LIFIPAACGERMASGGGAGLPGVLVCRGYGVIRWVARVCPAVLSRPASVVPIAVAGEGTPARS
jgi:hypothetical protein